MCMGINIENSYLLLVRTCSFFFFFFFFFFFLVLPANTLNRPLNKSWWRVHNNGASPCWKKSTDNNLKQMSLPSQVRNEPRRWILHRTPEGTEEATRLPISSAAPRVLHGTSSLPYCHPNAVQDQVNGWNQPCALTIPADGKCIHPTAVRIPPTKIKTSAAQPSERSQNSQPWAGPITSHARCVGQHPLAPATLSPWWIQLFSVRTYSILS